jgi:hypothetical protein
MRRLPGHIVILQRTPSQRLMPKLSRSGFRQGSPRSAIRRPKGRRPMSCSIKTSRPKTRLTFSAEWKANADQRASKTARKRSRKVAVGPLGKTVRLRDKDHRKFVMRRPCLVCGRVPSDPHHLRFTQPRALGRTVSDEFLVPICRLHHRELHRSGDEATWWQKLNIDPIPVALRLWQQTQAGPKLVATTGDVTQGQAAKIPDGQP